MQVLRLSLPRETRQTSLRMTDHYDANFRIRTLDLGNDFDFDQQIARQTRYFNRGARRQNAGAVRKKRRVHRIHGCEIVHVFQEDGGFDDLAQAAAPGFEHGFQVCNGSLRLFLDAAGNNLPGDGVEPTLASGEDKVADAYTLRIRADGGRRTVCCDD